ncbi:hypothetical protein [Sulfitobacter sp. SK012]|uniref:hypothetical protein n=1 Tax=Sulfitobacter sp. SK012 TaxID=1389005 RepID=UPI0013B3BB90|nr:hypothetical protein [Sulfitobacter sp. SK012]
MTHLSDQTEGGLNEFIEFRNTGCGMTGVEMSELEQQDLELRFLNGWASKFPNKNGGRHSAPIERRYMLASRLALI